jgi:hypothetical protein
VNELASSMNILDRQPVKPGEKWLIVTDNNLINAADPHYDQKNVQTYAQKEQRKKDQFIIDQK